MKNPQVETERLWLRRWRDEDCQPFRALNSDPRVAEFLPGVLTAVESDALIERFEAQFRDRGFGPWAVEEKRSGTMLGFVGLNVPTFDAHFTPCVEIGWRLSADSWGQGYASEAARAAVEFGFTVAKLEEIVSLTVPHNVRSRRVMERLGMIRDERDDFEHPRLPPGHPLRSHVLYRLRPEWKEKNAKREGPGNADG